MNQKDKGVLRFVPYLICLFLPFLVFYKILLGNTFLVGDFTGSDLLDLHLPFKHILHENYTKFDLPLWEPNLALGFPVLAEGQSGVFYLPNILLSFISAQAALNLSILLTFVFAGSFVCLYVRSLGYGKYSSIFTSLTFSFSAFFVARIKHINLIAVSCWVPFVYWSIRSGFVKKRTIYFLFAALGVAMQMFAGHPQMTYYSIFVYAIYTTFELVLYLKSNKNVSSAITKGVVSYISISILPLFLSAAQILPTLELARLSDRPSFTLESVKMYPFTLKYLSTLFLPYFYGNPATGTYTGDINEVGVFWENVLYIGIIPLVLAIFSLLMVFRKKRDTHQVFFVFLSGLCLVLMLGPATPIYAVLWKLMPGFSLFRFPSRFNLFLILSLSVLAGYGLEKAAKYLENFKFKNPQGGEEKFDLSWPLSYRQNAILLTLFAVFDLFLFARSYVSYIPNGEIKKRPDVISTFTDGNDYFRIINFSQYGKSPYAQGWRENDESIMSVRNLMPPNNNSMYDISSFNDRGWFEGGLGLKRRNSLENYILFNDLSVDFMKKIFGMFNVKYFISSNEKFNLGMEKIKEYELQDKRKIKYYVGVYSNDMSVPEAFFASETRLISEDEFIDVVKEDNFDPKTVVLVENKADIIDNNSERSNQQNIVEIINYKNTEIQISVRSGGKGYLVLNDLYYPGWKVEVDDEESEIVRANHLVRAVRLDPGQHVVRFFYDPASVKTGILLSCLGFALTGGLICWSYKKNL